MWIQIEVIKNKIIKRINKKQLVIAWVIIALILSCSSISIAEDKIDEGSSEAWIMGRLRAIDETLQQEMSPKERAKLFYEKANLMHDAYKPKVGLRVLTECILKAIELDPDNQKYKDYLREIYNKEWKDRTFHGNDGYSELMIQLKNRVESIIGKILLRQK